MIAEQLDMKQPLIFEIPNILTEAECHQWIGRIRSTGTEPAPINTTRGAEIDAQIRNNRRVIFDDAERANNLFVRVKDRIPQEIHGMILAGVNERLRCCQLLHLNASALLMELAVPSFVFTPERMVFRERTASGRLTIGFERTQCGPAAPGI